MHTKLHEKSVLTFENDNKYYEYSQALFDNDIHDYIHMCVCVCVRVYMLIPHGNYGNKFQAKVDAVLLCDMFCIKPHTQTCFFSLVENLILQWPQCKRGAIFTYILSHRSENVQFQRQKKIEVKSFFLNVHCNHACVCVWFQCISVDAMQSARTSFYYVKYRNISNVYRVYKSTCHIRNVNPTL